jgi:DNA-binding PadR family transcriptional regulator
MPKADPRLVPLEILILLCAKTGIGTPYAIMTKMGVGVGASSPALKRLEAEGLLSSEPGERNSRQYSITERGEALLRSALDAGPMVYGADHTRRFYVRLGRVIFFAWVKGDLDEARVEIDKAEADLMRAARRLDVEAKEYRKILQVSNYEATVEHGDPSHYVPLVYRFIDAVADTAEARMNAQAISALRKLIDELPTSPRTFLQYPSGRSKDAAMKVEARGNTIITSNEPTLTVSSQFRRKYTRAHELVAGKGEISRALVLSSPKKKTAAHQNKPSAS